MGATNSGIVDDEDEDSQKSDQMAEIDPEKIKMTLIEEMKSKLDEKKETMGFQKKFLKELEFNLSFIKFLELLDSGMFTKIICQIQFKRRSTSMNMEQENTFRTNILKSFFKKSKTSGTGNEESPISPFQEFINHYVADNTLLLFRHFFEFSCLHSDDLDFFEEEARLFNKIKLKDPTMKKLFPKVAFTYQINYVKEFKIAIRSEEDRRNIENMRETLDMVKEQTEAIVKFIFDLFNHLFNLLKLPKQEGFHKQGKSVIKEMLLSPGSNLLSTSLLLLKILNYEDIEKFENTRRELLSKDNSMLISTQRYQLRDSPELAKAFNNEFKQFYSSSVAFQQQLTINPNEDLLSEIVQMAQRFGAHLETTEKTDPKSIRGWMEMIRVWLDRSFEGPEMEAKLDFVALVSKSAKSPEAFIYFLLLKEYFPEYSKEHWFNTCFQAFITTIKHDI